MVHKKFLAYFLLILITTTKTFSGTISLPTFDDPQATFTVTTRESSSIDTHFLPETNVYFNNSSTIIYERSPANLYGPYAYASSVSLDFDIVTSTVVFTISAKNGTYLRGIKIDLDFSFDAGTFIDQNLIQITVPAHVHTLNDPNNIKGYSFAEFYLSYGSGTFQLGWMKTADQLKQEFGIDEEITGIELWLGLELVAASNLYGSQNPEPASVNLHKISVSNVPEPSALLLLAVGLGGLAVFRNRRS